MRLLWNIVLALFWAALWGTLSLPFLLMGLALGYLVLLALETTEVIENKYYGRKVWRCFSFFFFFIKELWVSTLSVAIDVLRPSPKFSPAIVKVPLDLVADSQITLLANVITLTPGTLTLDISPDRKFIYVHTMFYDPSKRQAFIDGIKLGFEKRIRELFES